MRGVPVGESNDALKPGTLARAIGALRRRAMLFRLVRSVDKRRLEELRERYKGTDWGDSKHWNVRNRMALNLGHVYALDLHRAAPQRILDLGAGCGYFPYICARVGHTVLAVDMDVPMYRDVTALLRVPWREWRIEAFRKLPDFGARFDVVTALLVYFSNPHRPDVWGADEWRFFLADVAVNQLNADGRIYLVLNKDTEGRYYSPDLLSFFADSGARIDGAVVRFDEVETIRQVYGEAVASD